LSVLLAVDWSGDPGVDPKSPSLCIMSVVAYDEHALGAALAKLREQNGKSKDFEFHYTDIDDRELKDDFMAAVAHTFMGSIVVYNKDAMATRDAWGRDTSLLVQLIIQCVLLLPEGTIKDAKMTIDGKREVKVLERALRPSLSAALRARYIEGRLSKIRHAQSLGHDGLQLADMVGGAVREAIKRGAKETLFLRSAHTVVRVMRTEPEMEKPLSIISRP